MSEFNLIPPSIQKRNQNQAPLSASQEGLWFLHQLEPDSPAYNLIYLFKMSGGVDREILERSLDELVRRHEVLRAIYPTDQKGKPFQVIQPFEPILLAYVDYSSLEASEMDLTIREYALEHGLEPYDLEKGPLMRVCLFHSGPEEDFLFLAVHHIVFDESSRFVFVQDLLQLYASYRSGQEPNLAPLPIQYSDYVLWQEEWLSGETRETFIQHWKDILSGDLPILPLPTDRPRQAVQIHHGSRYYFEVSPRLSARLRTFSTNEGLTRFQVLLAAYAVLLMRYTSQGDIIIGCPFANRPLPEQEGMIGYFVNSLPIRLNLEGNPTVREFLAQVHTVMQKASTWKGLPFETMVAEIAPQRDLSRTPIFQASINMLNMPRRQKSIPGLDVDLIFREQKLADDDISIEFSEIGGHFNACMLYNTDLFEESTILRMASHYRNILEEILTKPDRSLSELEMLSADERQQILVDWNNTATDYPREKCIHQSFEEQAERTPDSPAVIFQEQQLTYREINEHANQLANHLRQLGVGSETTVGLYIERSIEVIVGILAILKAGGAFIPLATDMIQNRRDFILQDARPIVVVTLDKLRAKLSGNAFQVVCLDSERDKIFRESKGNLDSNANPSSMACVIYTSGSTGVPKGVVLVHRAICNNLHYFITTYQTQATDRVLQHMSLSFDFSLQEIFIALLSGACLVLANQENESDVNYLAQLIEEQKITIAGFVPSHLDVFLETRKRYTNSQLRQVVCGGEVLTGELQRRFFEKYTANLFNTYGPTEATIDVCHWTCKRDGVNDIVPIGKPIQNTQLFVLDKWLLPVPIGVPGELYIGGDCLARGYLNRPDLTAEKFIPDLFSKKSGKKLYKTGDQVRYLPDGNVEFLGRLDDQVKLRGFRIELGEIESAIRQYPEVGQILVMVREDRPGDKRLVAYVIPASEFALEVEKLRGFLQKELPAYMIPSAFVQMDAFPLTISAKIDRKALPVPDQNSLAIKKEYAPPRDDLERQLVRIWEKVLNFQPVGIEDDFFELGGHSLLAVHLFAEIEKSLGKRLPLASLFQSPTISGLATMIRDGNPPVAWSSIVPIKPEGHNPPFFMVHGIGGNILNYHAIAKYLDSDQPFYGLQSKGLDGKSVPLYSVEDMAAHYVCEMCEFFPEGPYLIGGHSFGGWIAMEMAIQLHQKGRDAALVILVDTGADTFDFMKWPERVVLQAKRLTERTSNIA